jgi:integrase
LRRNEILKLKWRDVDLENRTVTVIAENARTQRERTVGITSRLLAELERLHRNRARITCPVQVSGNRRKQADKHALYDKADKLFLNKPIVNPGAILMRQSLV